MGRLSRWILFSVVVSAAATSPTPAAAQAPFDPQVLLRIWFGNLSVERAAEPTLKATESVPRMAWKQVMFKRAEFMLKLPDYRLDALNLIRSEMGQRTAYVFEEAGTVGSDAVADIAWQIGQHRRIPPGWEHRVIPADFSLQPLKP